ncbi:MAG TPA: peptide deformylase [Coxiellaceae bacterium]|nr:MAG: peptide deformylase [Gammaproteobacteria bacterium RIFCSPHIGHO2_12_FULL_36_30]HLB56529.1 peptide deformylase [Coxiellaceae bacterium]
MSIKSIVKLGNKQLATPSMPVTVFSTLQLHALIQDMQDTLKEKGGVGIAAPQVGDNLRVIIFGFEKSVRYPHEVPIAHTVLINPIIEPLSDEMNEAWEGCLSVPGLRGLVSRFSKIKYSGFDADGNAISRIVENFHARVVQHECDHLDGVLFPERIKDMRYFGFEDELFKK